MEHFSKQSEENDPYIDYDMSTICFLSVTTGIICGKTVNVVGFDAVGDRIYFGVLNRLSLREGYKIKKILNQNQKILEMDTSRILAERVKCRTIVTS